MNMLQHMFFLLIIITLMNCGSDPENYTVEVIDGVRHVHNLAPKWGDEQKIELVFVRTIGGLDAVDENYQFYRISDLKVDREGNLYVLDSGNGRIQVFDIDGKYLKTIGRPGQGPGELDKPYGMYIRDNGEILVSKFRTIIIFSPDGKEIGRHSTDDTIYELNITNRSDYVFPTSAGKYRESDNIKEEIKLVSIFDSEFKLSREFGDTHDFGDNEKNYWGNNINIVLDEQDNVYVCMSEVNRIDKYDLEGDLVFRMDRPTDIIPEFTVTKRTINVGGKPMEIESKGFSRISWDVDIDEKNRLWIHTYKRRKKEGETFWGDFMYFEIFDSEGILLTTVPMPCNGNLYIHGERLFFDDSGQECVHEYRIVENNN